MDNNQPQNPVPGPAVNTSPVPTVPVQNPEVISTLPQPEVVETRAGKAGHGSKIILIILALIFLGILAAGAFYYYQMRQTAVEKAPSPTPAPASTPDPLVEETQNITVEDVNGNFVEVDEELKQL